MGEISEVKDPMERVGEVFLEMKDTSELMVDLAYSSLLFNNGDLASEVEHLGDRVDELSSELKRLAIEGVAERSRDATMMILSMEDFVSSIASAAMSISDVVLRDIEPHPLLRQVIRESDAGIYKMEIRSNSILAERTLGDLRIATETGMWVFAIKRQVRWIYGPEKGVVLKKGDIMFVRGPEDGAKKLRMAAKGKVSTLE
ncbi:MAG: PhoU family transcriptional regulator [Candidatus Thermoplasmatota archaeon]|nr:PhoU family transcriptional regulator [Candidatus Thermoplasmatota archaeon]